MTDQGIPSLQLCIAPTVENYQDLSEQLSEKNEEYLVQFLRCGGLEILLTSLEKYGGQGFNSISHSLLHLECLTCVKHVFNHLRGMDYAIQKQKCISMLLRSIDTTNSMVKRQIWEIGSACCLHSTKGHSNILKALEDYKNDKHQRYRFSLVINEIKSQESLTYKTTILGFINCIINSIDRLSERCKIRDELIGLGWLDCLNHLRYEDDDDILIQCEVFDRQKRADDLLAIQNNQKPHSHDDLFQAILVKISSTPSATAFLRILQYFLSVNPNDCIGSRIWSVLEKAVQRVVLYHKFKDAEDILASVIELVGSRTQQEKTKKCNSLLAYPKQKVLFSENNLSTKKNNESENNLSKENKFINRSDQVVQNSVHFRRLSKEKLLEQMPLSVKSAITALEKSLEKDQLKNKMGKKSTPEQRTKLLPWIKLQPKQFNTGKCLWKDIQSSNPCVDFHFDEIEKLFKDEKMNELQLLSLTRSLQINLFLAMFDEEYDLVIPQELVNAIANGDYEQFETEQLQYLHEILPNEEEALLFKDISEEIIKLPRAEQFLHYLSQIPNIQDHVEAMLSHGMFTCQSSRLKKNLESVISSSQSILSSSSFIGFMRLILDLGNFLNYGSCLGGCQAFHFKVLTELQEVCCSWKGRHLLHYLVDIAQEQKPELLTWLQEFDKLETASKLSLVDLQSSVDALETQVNHIKLSMPGFLTSLRQYMQSFLLFASKELIKLKTELDKVRQLSMQLCQYLECTEKSFQLHVFFALLEEFRNNVKTANEENIQRKSQQQISCARQLQLFQLAQEKSLTEPETNIIDHYCAKVRIGSILNVPETVDLKEVTEIEDEIDLMVMRPVSAARCFPRGVNRVKRSFSREAQELSATFDSPDNNHIQVDGKFPKISTCKPEGNNKNQETMWREFENMMAEVEQINEIPPKDNLQKPVIGIKGDKNGNNSVKIKLNPSKSLSQGNFPSIKMNGQVNNILQDISVNVEQNQTKSRESQNKLKYLTEILKSPVGSNPLKQTGQINKVEGKENAPRQVPNLRRGERFVKQITDAFDKRYILRVYQRFKTGRKEI